MPAPARDRPPLVWTSNATARRCYARRDESVCAAGNRPRATCARATARSVRRLLALAMRVGFVVRAESRPGGLTHACAP
eukprot:33521-Pleurochrysis_carterae.AAC.1